MQDSETIPHPGRVTRTNNFPLYIILALAAVIRLAGIGIESVWFDEAYSIRLATAPVTELLERTANDTHPPLYYLMLKGWLGIAGDGDAAARALSTLWSLLGVVLMYLAGNDIAGRRAGLLAASLMAVNPLDVAFAQECRMYEPATVLGFAASWITWNLIRASNELSPDADEPTRSRVVLYLGYTILVTAMIYMHAVTVLIAVAQGLALLPILLLRKRFGAILRYIICAAACAMMFYPWIFYVHKFRDAEFFYIDTQLSAWMPMPRAPEMLTFVVREFIWGHTVVSPDAASLEFLPAIRPLLAALSALCLVAVACGIAGLPAVIRRGSRDPRAGALVYCAWMTFAPVVLCYILSLVWQPIYYRPRFAHFVLPPFLLGCSILLDLVPGRKFKRVPPAVFLFITACAAILQTVSQDKRDIRGAARFCARNMPDDAAIVFAPFFDRLTFEHYAGDGFNVMSDADIRSAQASPVAPDIWMVDSAGPDDNPNSRNGWLRSLRPRQTIREFGHVRIDRITFNREPGVFQERR